MNNINVTELYNSDRLYDLDYTDCINYTESSMSKIRMALLRTNKRATAIKINAYKANSDKFPVGIVGIRQDLIAYIANEYTTKIIVCKCNKDIFADIYYSNRGEWVRFELEPA